MSHKATAEQFINAARAVHGAGTYDYSRVVYRGRQQTITIICPAHGLFEQTPCTHTRGRGCPACGRARTAASRADTPADFIQKARAVHGDKYDYSQVLYSGSKKKVLICCPTHGTFSQKPADHIGAGAGCPHCKAADLGDRLRSNSADFIQKARAVHGDKYDYSQVLYSTCREKVTVVCPLHGAFSQQANSHLRGVGCMACGAAKSWVDLVAGRPATLYFLKVYGGEECFFKVGITIHSVALRYRKVGSLAGYSYEVLAQHTSTNAARVYGWEQSILETFAHLRYTPQQHFPGATECLSSADEILSIFPI